MPTSGHPLHPHYHDPHLSAQSLVDLRASQRTYQGAWLRTSLANLGYAAVVLKIFEARYFSIGILYTLLSLLLLIASLKRSSTTNRSILPPSSPLVSACPRLYLPPSPFKKSLRSFADPSPPSDGRLSDGEGGQDGKKTFETSGPLVLVFGGLVAGLEVALLVLVWRFGG